MRIQRKIATFSITAVLAAGMPLVAPVKAAPAVSRWAGISTNRVIVYHSPLAHPTNESFSFATGSDASVLSGATATKTIVSLGESLEGAELERAITAIDNMPGVIKVEPSYRMKAFDVTPNDPGYPGGTGQWYLQKSGSHAGASNLPAAWSMTKGSTSTVVAILDTGYTLHDDLNQSRIVAQADFVSEDEPGVFISANDGNGWDTNARDPGDSISSADAAYFSANGMDCPVSESSWHGTHVTGIVAASSNNGVGVTGVDWNTKLVQIRVLGECGGTDSDIAAGIRWAAGLHVEGMPDNPFPADVINMSLGGNVTPGSGCTSSYRDAISEATVAGSVIVVAAGNANEDTADVMPANCADVITVGAIDSDGMRSDFGFGDGSNFGSEVDVMAPGSHILNILNDGSTGPIADTSSAYYYLDGTSMATPVVSGIVALMQGVRHKRNLDPLEPTVVEYLIKEYARAFTAGTDSQPFSCKNPSFPCGAGIIDAARLVWNVSSPKVLVNRNNLKITYPVTSISNHFKITRNGSVIKSNQLSGNYSDPNRALTAGVYEYTVISVGADGVEVPSDPTTFTVQIPAAPVLVASSGVGSGRFTVALQPSSPAIKQWCIYVDNVYKKCVPARTKTSSVALPRGRHRAYVQASTSRGTSGKSNVVIFFST